MTAWLGRASWQDTLEQLWDDAGLQSEQAEVVVATEQHVRLLVGDDAAEDELAVHAGMQGRARLLVSAGAPLEVLEAELAAALDLRALLRADDPDPGELSDGSAAIAERDGLAWLMRWTFTAAERAVQLTAPGDRDLPAMLNTLSNRLGPGK